jgi:hypothetical protein
MLEKEMGINQFSIYGNKQAFSETWNVIKLKYILFSKNYKTERSKWHQSVFLWFSKDAIWTRNHKGCLLTTTYNEFTDTEDQIISEQMNEFMNNLKAIFIEIKADNSKDETSIEKQANYLLSKTRFS